MVERESEIIAQAGRVGAITISTNMAGRGTDIILGGNSAFMARLKPRELLMPMFLRNDQLQPKHPANDRDFYPCDIRQETKAAVEEVKAELQHTIGINKWSSLEFERLLSQAAEKAPTQNNLILKLRKAINQVKTDYNTVLQAEAKTVRAAGGLHVIGTELHDSRRVGNQLRGRAGRQGDPGSTRFFLSLEDKLMQLFGGNKLVSLLEQFHEEEGQAMNQNYSQELMKA